MGTLSGLLNSTRAALLADQTALEVTAANISNQNTVGYTKRTVSFTAGDTVQISGLTAGTGATATVVTQRDRVLDRSLQQATDTAASSGTRLAALKNLESLFTIDSSGSDSSGIQAALSSFFTGVAAIAADPTSTSARQSTLAAAQTLAVSFNRTASSISTQTAALNSQVSTGVTQVNSLLTQIAAQNLAIASTAPTDDRSTIEDARTQLITQLSGLIGLQQTTGENGQIALSTTNGSLLVDGGQTYQLGTTNVSGTARVYASSAIGGAEITSLLHGGSIAGAILTRDTDLAAVTSQLDTLAFSIATTVNSANAAGNTAAGTAGSTIFAVGTTAAGAATSIAVSLTDPSGIAAASTSEGAGGNSNANALLALQSANTTGGTTYAGAYSTLLSGLGTTITSATSDSAADTAIQTQLATQRDSTSGISLDEEAANLTQYQRSYQAAAKLLSILDTLLATAINLGTDTAVS